MTRTIMALLTLALGSAAMAQEDAYTPKSKLAHLELQKYELEENVFVPMRDGIRLSAEIRFPKEDRKNLPTVLIRSPYEPATQARSWALRMVSFLENGYAVAFVNAIGAGHGAVGVHDLRKTSLWVKRPRPVPVLPPLSVGEMTLRLYAALNYSQNSARDLRRALNGA